jgi:hypothetical protein
MRSSIIAILVTSALGGCNSAPQWSSGDYEVYWISSADELKLGVDVGGGMQALVMPRVIAVGEDVRWIVAKRHPDNDPIKTEYFYLPKKSRNERKKGTDVALGPFTEKEFEMKAKELKLPPFSQHF